eukprot:XP_014773788.1 PREDICTED: uncharacterized protein K02A2.6-like [Octopus bimaculoides]
MCKFLDRTKRMFKTEEILSKPNGGKLFSKLGLSDAYLQIQVEDECTKLLTINTYKGLYKFNWFTFGIKVAPTISLQVKDAVLAECNFMMAYLDDILIKNECRDQHV